MTNLTSENRSLPEIRQLPAVEERVETGPIAFGEDWPGVFIRGDTAAWYAQGVENFLNGQTDPLTVLAMNSLRELLHSSNLVRAVMPHLPSDLESPSVIGPAAPLPTPQELCDALHREEEGNETHEIPTRDLLAITSLLESHPKWWDYPCFCAECRSYVSGDV